MSDRRLAPGQKRTMRHKIFKPPFDVVAYCYDPDTPYVILHRDGVGGQVGMHESLTDSQARELIEMLKRAISILPTSK